MLTPPDLPTTTITAFLREHYGLPARQVTFLPIGADAYAAVYRVEANDGTPYFLKLRWGSFDELTVAIPAFLHDAGIAQVMAALPTTTGGLWAEGHGFAWILYPFFEGDNGFATPLTDAQWIALGQSLKAVHASALPAELAARAPREDYSPRWRDIVTRYAHDAETRAHDDPVARRMAALWVAERQEIQTMVERAAHLGQQLQQRTEPDAGFVLCHTDLHAGNVLLSAHNELALAIVDWDAPIFALKERDLMFMGGGVGAIWHTPREESLFYQGYGAVEIDLVALAYYRYERIVEDMASYGEQVFEAQGSVEDRENGLKRVTGLFQPGSVSVLPIAHETYARLPQSAR